MKTDGAIEFLFKEVQQLSRQTAEVTRKAASCFSSRIFTGCRQRSR